MKNMYERPLMRVEMFVASNAVAASCTVTDGIEWEFDCMAGPNTDTRNVISNEIGGSTCNSNVAYYGGINTAIDYSKQFSRNHSNNAGGTWTDTNGNSGHMQVTYSNAEGLFVADADNRGNISTANWSATSAYASHDNKGGLMHHMVSPVLSAANISQS